MAWSYELVRNRHGEPGSSSSRLTLAIAVHDVSNCSQIMPGQQRAFAAGDVLQSAQDKDADEGERIWTSDKFISGFCWSAESALTFSFTSHKRSLSHLAGFYTVQKILRSFTLFVYLPEVSSCILSFIVGCLPYSIKHHEVTGVVIWCFIKKTELKINHICRANDEALRLVISVCCEIYIYFTLICTLCISVIWWFEKYKTWTRAQSNQNNFCTWLLSCYELKMCRLHHS